MWSPRNCVEYREVLRRAGCHRPWSSSFILPVVVIAVSLTPRTYLVRVGIQLINQSVLGVLKDPVLWGGHTDMSATRGYRGRALVGEARGLERCRGGAAGEGLAGGQGSLGRTLESKQACVG